MAPMATGYRSPTGIETIVLYEPVFLRSGFKYRCNTSAVQLDWRSRFENLSGAFGHLSGCSAEVERERAVIENSGCNPVL